MQNTVLVLVRKSERQAQYVFEGECKSSDAECSAAPKMRFCENTKPHLFLLFSESSGRESNSPSGRSASRPGRTVRKGAGESLPAHQR